MIIVVFTHEESTTFNIFLRIAIFPWEEATALELFLLWPSLWYLFFFVSRHEEATGHILLFGTNVLMRGIKPPLAQSLVDERIDLFSRTARVCIISFHSLHDPQTEKHLAPPLQRECGTLCVFLPFLFGLLGSPCIANDGLVLFGDDNASEHGYSALLAEFEASASLCEIDLQPLAEFGSSLERQVYSSPWYHR